MATVLKRSRIQIWRDVIFALFVREIRSGFNDKFGLAWALLNPLSFVLLLSYVRSLLGGETSYTMPTFTFMAVGMGTVQMFVSTVSAVAATIKKNKALFAFRQVQPISAVLATALFEVNLKFFVIASLVVAMFILNIELVLYDPLTFILCQFLIVVTACSVGFMFAMFGCYFQEIQKVLGVLMRPMLFISAVFYSLQDLPKEYWSYFLWNPVVHAIELSRQAMYPTYGAVGVKMGTLLLITLGCLSLSLAYYHSHWKEAISR